MVGQLRQANLKFALIDVLPYVGNVFTLGIGYIAGSKKNKAEVTRIEIDNLSEIINQQQATIVFQGKQIDLISKHCEEREQELFEEIEKLKKLNK